MRKAIFVVLLVLVLPAQTWADGFKMKNGRYASGPVTVLDLTAEQLLTVRTMRVMVLTGAQKARLRAATGVAPGVLQVYSLKRAGTACTCFDFNISIWFAPERVEVPHQFLLSDADAEQYMDDLESSD